MSTLLLFLLGLCSIASPHDLQKATVHHRAPALAPFLAAARLKETDPT